MNFDEVAANCKEKIEDAFPEDTVIKLIDVKAGFRIERPVSADKKKQLGISAMKNLMSVISIVIHEELPSDASGEKFPVFLRIELVLKENSHYEKERGLKSRLGAPIDISSRGDEYLFDASNGKFIKNATVEVDIGKEVEVLYAKHLSPSWRIVIKIILLNLAVKLCYLGASASTLLLFLLFGKRLGKVFDILFRESNKKELTERSVEVVSPETINFLGYNVSKWSLASYSLLVILIILLCGYAGQEKVYEASVGNLLVITLVMFSLVVYEKLIPSLLEMLAKKLAAKHYQLLFSQVPV